MPLTKCPRCDQLWNRNEEQTVCKDCTPAEQADKAAIRDALDGNPGADKEALAEIAGVEISVVSRMLDEGVLVRELDIGKIVCGRCGAPALGHKQRLCVKCLRALDTEMMQARKDMSSKIESGKPDESVHQTIQKKRRESL